MGNAIENLIDALGAFDRVDLTHTLDTGIPSYPTHPKYSRAPWRSLGDPAELNQLILSDHTGTHGDSPSHFVADESDPARLHIDEIDVFAFVGRAVTMAFGPFEPTCSLVTKADIVAWEEQNVAVRAQDVVLLNLNWAYRWRPIPEGFAFLDGWPGIDRSAAEYLAAKGVKAVGTDCMSLDSADGGGGALPAHLTLLPRGILILENLANLDALPPVSFFIALPLKIREGTGSPVRAVALVPRTTGC